MNDDQAFARLVDALRPWHAHLVDLAFAARANLSGSIADALKAAGFHEEFLGDDAPPVTHYHIGESNQGFYVEFLSPLTGSGTTRSGAADATLTVAGVTAQKLRHLDLLLLAPWQLSLDAGSAIPIAAPATLMVANPVAFVAQKLLIHSQRKPGKRAQDALYVHDTIQLFGERIGRLKLLWTDVVRPSLPANVATAIPRLITQQFGAVNDVTRSAVRIPQDRAITPEAFQAACEAGLEEIFGTG